jgi:hypothetical protein
LKKGGKERFILKKGEKKEIYMKTNKLKILYIILFLLLPYSFSSSQGFANHGAFIFTAGKTYIKVNNFDFKNFSGIFKLKFGSRLTTTNNILNGGDFYTYDSSLVTTGLNFVNSDTVSIMDTSTIIVKKNVINSGGVFNGHMIEIGE